MDFNNNEEVAPGDQQKHPLLIPEIMENVLVFCKGHRDQNDNRTFLSLRLVCKIWDVEVCKFLRRETEMPLPRILSPYPDGLGWKWNRSHKTPGYQYQSPYLETPEFESVRITAEACKVIKDPKVIRWFKVMGGQVKSLHYTSPLNCSHQNVFLGHVLHSWCPNLETLHLSGIQCFSSLLYFCEGKEEGDREFSGAFNCTKLKHLIISVDSEDPSGQFLECNHKTDYCFLDNRRRHIFSAEFVHSWFLNMVEIFPEKTVEVEKYAEVFDELVVNAVKMDKIGANFLNDKFKLLVKRYAYHRFGITDWGVVGLILRVAPLQKIVIRKLGNLEHCRNLMIFLLYQPSKLRSTLKHLELQNDASVGKSFLCLKTLSMFKCPLKILRLDNLMPLENLMGCLYDSLRRCADTLNTLEIDIAQTEDEDGGGEGVEVEILKFEIPALPNLQKFVHRNLSRLPLEGNGFLRNCPNLKICKFFVGDNLKYGFLGRWALNLFCDELANCAGNELGHPLRELEICGRNLRFGNIEGLGAGLKNLVKVDFEVEGWVEFKCFLGWMGGRCGKLESVRISVASKYGGDVDGGDRWNQLISEDIHKIESVKFLDLVFRGKEVKLGVDAFKNGFGKLKKLTSLKITNFWVEAKDWMEIGRFIGHIQFVGFSKMHWYSQGENWVRERLSIM